MKKWQIENQTKVKDLVKVLLENRGIKTKAEIERFLNPKLAEVTPKAVKINAPQLKKAVENQKGH